MHLAQKKETRRFEGTLARIALAGVVKKRIPELPGYCKRLLLRNQALDLSRIA
jgi:hypothetical protein